VVVADAAVRIAALAGAERQPQGSQAARQPGSQAVAPDANRSLAHGPPARAMELPRPGWCTSGAMACPVWISALLLHHGAIVAWGAIWCFVPRCGSSSRSIAKRTRAGIRPLVSAIGGCSTSANHFSGGLSPRALANACIALGNSVTSSSPE
jgi:hypothetical protein